MASSIESSSFSSGPHTLTFGESLGVLLGVVAPLAIKGPIIRRRIGMQIVEKFGLDRRAVERLRRLRTKHGSGPVWVRNPGRPQLLVLSAEQAGEILAATPTLYSPASREKIASLAHFEPHVSLISRGEDRTTCRSFNDHVLESRNAKHRLAERLAEIVTHETGDLLAATARTDISWGDFAACWLRIVRRVVLGDSARDDTDLTELLARLRRNANLAFAYPKDRPRRARLLKRIDEYIARGEQGSLAGIISAMPIDVRTWPAHQVVQWLFAFDAGAMGTFRTLALLAVHEDILSRARAEVWSPSIGPMSHLSFLRVCFTDALRLWPTSPVLLRQAARPTVLCDTKIPAGAGIIIYAPYFHRDSEKLADANGFNPERWQGRDPPAVSALFPFSAGPGACPGRHVVTLIAAEVLARLICNDLQLVAPRIDVDQELPHSLNHFAIRFRLRSPGGGAQRSAASRSSAAATKV
jgi:hypothetical protein